MLNEKLYSYYKSKLPDLEKLYSKLDQANITEYTGPYFIQCWEENYKSAKVKLMIIGQETDGWYAGHVKSEEDLRELLKKYEDQKLGQGSSAAFWKAADYISGKLNGSCNLNYVQNTVNKFGLVKVAGKPEQAILDGEDEYVNVLAKEIEILKPDACIFLSGPEYDDDIGRKIPDVKFQPLLEGGDSRKLALLKSSQLPECSYRTYHPKYGNINHDSYYQYLDEIIAHIQKKKNPSEKKSEKKKSSWWKILLIVLAVVILILLLLLLFRSCNNKGQPALEQNNVVENTVVNDSDNSLIEKAEETVQKEAVVTSETSTEPVNSAGKISVKPGDTYTRIAQREYGDGNLWPLIYAANADLRTDPDALEKDDQLILPALTKDNTVLVQAYLKAYQAYKKQGKWYRSILALAAGEKVSPGLLKELEDKVPSSDLIEAKSASLLK